MNAKSPQSFEDISNEHPTLLVDFLKELKRDFREQKSSIIKNIVNYKNKDNSPPLLGWYYLYELPTIYTITIFFQLIGIRDLLTLDKNSLTPNLDLLKRGNDDSLLDEIDVNNLEVDPAIFGLFLYALMKNINCIERYGLHMSELLEKGRNGDDPSFFKAVRIDNTITHTPSFIKRSELAYLQNDKRFNAGLRKALKGQSKMRWNSYDTTRVVIKLFQEAGQLDTKSINELYQIFCVDSFLYPNTGKDPARSLHQFILRFRNDTST